MLLLDATVVERYGEDGKSFLFIISSGIIYVQFFLQQYEGLDDFINHSKYDAMRLLDRKRCTDLLRMF